MYIDGTPADTAKAMSPDVALNACWSKGPINKEVTFPLESVFTSVPAPFVDNATYLNAKFPEHPGPEEPPTVRKFGAPVCTA